MKIPEFRAITHASMRWLVIVLPEAVRREEDTTSDRDKPEGDHKPNWTLFTK